MTIRTRMIAAVFAVMALGAVAQADPSHGVWQTEPDDGAFAHVELAACGAAICGTIIRTYENGGTPYQSPNIGRQIVIDMAPQGGGTYEGSVWRPSNDRIYIGRMALEGDRITLRGCVAGGLVCARQIWARVE